MFDIIYWPDPILSKVSEPVTDFDGLDYIAERLYETMIHHKGMGLSAPQVGMLKRITIMEVNDHRLTMINPEFLEANGTIRYTEACLSFPDLLVEIERANSVKVRWQDLDEKWNEGTFTGVEAVCVQHEMDHLNGITMLHYVSRFQRELITRKMRRKM